MLTCSELFLFLSFPITFCYEGGRIYPKPSYYQSSIMKNSSTALLPGAFLPKVRRDIIRAFF